MDFIKQNIIILVIIGLAGITAGLAILRPLPIEREMYYRTGECTGFQSWRLKRKNVQPIDYSRIREIPIAQNQIQAVIEEASTWPCLPYGHMFRIGFDPFHKDIVLNDETLSLHKEKKETVWIYIQHEYKDLEAAPLGINVIAYFDGRPEHIFIPYQAITWFDDPAHDFLLKPWATDKE